MGKSEFVTLIFPRIEEFYVQCGVSVILDLFCWKNVFITWSSDNGTCQVLPNCVTFQKFTVNVLIVYLLRTVHSTAGLLLLVQCASPEAAYCKTPQSLKQLGCTELSQQ